MENKKKKRTKREMLSYEDKPIEEYERDKVKKNEVLKNKKVKKVFIIGIILVITVGIFGVWRYISPENLAGSISSSKIQGNGFPVEIKGKTVNKSDICLLNNNFSYISDTQFQVINSTGGIVVDKRIKYSSPAMVSSGNYNLIYDTEGRGYQIESASGTLFEGDVEDNIFSAVILKNGCYAILSKKDGYASKLTVFNNDNTQKYAYYFSECYAISISLNKDATRAVVCGLDALKGSIISRVYVLDFDEEEPVAKIDFGNVTTYEVDFLENGNIALIGDKSAMIITSDYANKYEFTYNGYNLISKKVTNNSIILSLSPFEDGKSCEIWNISQNGIVNTTKTGLAITSMDIYKDKVAVLSNNKISVFNIKTEELINEYSVQLDSKSILYFDEKTIYILGTSEIRKLQTE